MTNWRHTLRIADVWQNDDLTWEEQREVIVKRIRRARWFDDCDFELLDAVNGLDYAEEEQEFDGYWEDFCDWADANLMWVETTT